MDQYTLNTQKWLKNNYAGLYSVDALKEDGKTGKDTIDALIAALQKELGFSNPNGVLGPATLEALDNLAPIKASLGKDKPSNIVKIIQGACYAKGYNANDGLLTGIYTMDTGGSAIMLMKSHILGVPLLSIKNADVDTSIWKCLLSMKQFRLLTSYGGSARIRQIQQDLNRNYSNYFEEFISTDGICQRDTITGIIFAIQKEEGFLPEQSNGNFGPSTSSKFPLLTMGTSSAFAKIAQWSLFINGHPVSFTGKIDDSTILQLNLFQEFMMLPKTNYIDAPMMKNLLLSTGDQNRPVKGADMATPLTQQHITALKTDAYVYEYVGRYITHGIINGKDKCLTLDEVELITSNGLSIFPIYQSSGDSVSYFNYNQGLDDGQAAVDKAKELQFPYGTTIYFAVDVDIMEGEMYGTVIPHFEGIRNALAADGYYNVGIYGSRNTCSIITDYGYSKYSFVSGMSTGFSGNLGFPMPKNWSFNQIGPGVAGTLEIDNVAVSGLDRGVRILQKPTLNVNELNNKLAQASDEVIRDTLSVYLKKFALLDNIISSSLSYNESILLSSQKIGNFTVDQKIKFSRNLSTPAGTKAIKLSFDNDGNISSGFKNDMLELTAGFGNIKELKDIDLNNIISSIASVGIKMKNGSMTTAVTSTYNSISLSFTLTSPSLLPEPSIVNGTASITFTTEISIKDSNDNDSNISFEEFALAVGLFAIPYAIVFFGWELVAVTGPVALEKLVEYLPRFTPYVPVLSN